MALMISLIVTILEILNGKCFYEILSREEHYIHTLHPEYNICLYPTKSGKPNLGRKLTKEWKQKIGEKSKLYKHSESTLKIVSENNKNNATKLEFKKDSETLNFNSWVEAALYFKTTDTTIQASYRRRKSYKGWSINKLSTQKKKIKVFLSDSEIIFNSFAECDRYFNMWRGYTSELVHRNDNNLIINKYKYLVI